MRETVTVTTKVTDVYRLAFIGYDEKPWFLDNFRPTANGKQFKRVRHPIIWHVTGCGELMAKRNRLDNASPVLHWIYCDYLGANMVVVDSCPVAIREAWEAEHIARAQPFKWQRSIGTRERYVRDNTDGSVGYRRVVDEYDAIQTSPGVEFCYTAEQQLRQDADGKTSLDKALERWAKIRIDQHGDIVPAQQTATTASGKIVPALPLEELGRWASSQTNRHCFAERLDVSIRGAFLYVTTAIAKAFRSICWRPGLSTGRLWFEFVDECVQTIALHHLALVRGIERFFSVVHGLRAVQTVFEFRYGAYGQAEDNAHERKRGGASIETVAARNGLDLSTAIPDGFRGSVMLDLIRQHGLTTQGELAQAMKLSPATISKQIKRIAAFNAVLDR
jgi:hypothetical protein